jgi:hypothetical protein
MSPFTFATFATTTLTRLFVTLFELKASEQAIILDFLLEYLHGPLKVIVDDPDLQATKLSQIFSPLSFHNRVRGEGAKTQLPIYYFLKTKYYKTHFS